MNGQSIIIKRPDGQSVLLPMDEIYSAEGRIRDVAIVNAQKAPELLSVFNMAYLVIIDHLTKLELLLNEAQKRANSRRSIVILDLVPEILKQKGIASARSPGGSEDQRQAVLDQDAEYLAAIDTVQMLKATRELLEGKKKALEMAYTSVKKILGGSTDWQDLNRNRNLSAGTNLAAYTPGQVVPR